MKKLYILIFGLMPIHFLLAQEQRLDKEQPPFLMTRAEEDYTYLKDRDLYEQEFWDIIKFIPLNKSASAHLSFGGQFRTRYEHYSNRFWLSELDQNFYSQRLALHSNLVLNNRIRLFVELYHGYTSHEEEFAEYDKLDLFQTFVDFNLFSNEEQKLSFRLGRQEMGLGANRLVGIREGPNIRRSYDMGRLIFSKETMRMQAFYGREVRPLFGVFDNEFTLFNQQAANPQLWGIYSQFSIGNVNGKNELYYFGFQAGAVVFNDVSGEETRHTIGLRRFGKLGKHWRYNSEVIYQFGEVGSNNISAFSIDTDWHYELINTQWKWSPGLKLEYTTGDKEVSDGKLNSFNPMYVNPAFYSLAATITPVNIMGIHPSVSFKPAERLKLYFEWAAFWRSSKNDGLYRPTRFINRMSDGVESKRIGHQFGGKMQYEINRHLSFDMDISYFVAGSFLKESGESESILHFAPTLNYRF